MNDNHILKPRERFTVNTTTALVLMVSDVRANAVVHLKKNLQRKVLIIPFTAWIPAQRHNTCVAQQVKSHLDTDMKMLAVSS